MTAELFNFLYENATKKHWNIETITSTDLKDLRPVVNRYDFKGSVSDLSEIPEDIEFTDMYSFNNELYVKRDESTLWRVISPSVEDQLEPSKEVMDQFEKMYQQHLIEEEVFG